MKALIFVSLFICQGWAIAPDVITEPLLGAKQCTWGPSYWCSNLTAAAGCNAVKHCIQTVWEHQQLPRDTDTVCQTCLKMVKEARDQLLSNETEGEIEEVFEGSCKLIPVKIVSKECCKLVDDFIPELIDTLASQMNPQVVCSVAGLCNNARVDGLIEEYESEANAPTEPPNTCEGCQTVITILEQKLERMSKDDVLQSFLQICGHMGSLSDACSNIVVTYFPEIYEHLDKNFNPTDVCLMTGECSAQFHTHANVEITPLSKVGFVPVEAKDDLPCELCEQLVTHLRELLIANTTETEFQRVLEGLCKQTKTFKDECLSIVDQYYGTIYNFLVSELNSTVACSIIGICPPSNYADQDAPIIPLLPVESAPKALELMNNNEASNEGPAIEIAAKPETMQLPIERIFVPHLQETYNKQVCVFCEYFLHYVQEAITTPRTVDEIKHFIDKACEKFPTSINETCINFVNTYGDAVVALLAQEIDPSTICPLIRACPSSDAKNVEVFAEETGNKENCPMCLFAVTELEQMVKNDKTKNNIKAALNKLCSHLSDKVAAECQDFVNTYTDTLVELMIADLTPQEVCVFLKLCDDKMPAKPLVVVMEEVEDHDLLTNEIPDFTVNGQYIIDVPSKPGGNNKPQCVICEFAMTKLQSLLKNKTTEEEIKEAVVNICNHLPKSVRGECTSFVNKYADLVIELLIGAMEPDEICAYIGLCDKKPRISKVVPLENAESMQTEKVGSPQCVICKLVMNQIEKYIIGTTTKEEIVSALYGICAILPRSEEDSCNEFVRQHGDQIAELILLAAEPSEICSLMFLCTYQQELLQHEIQQCALCQAAYFNYIFLSELKEDVTVRNICAPMTQDYKMECYKMFKLNKRGLFGHFGEEDSADACRKLDYCEGETQYLRLRRDLVGSNKCTWGPSYWCASKSNAEECGPGAVDHCNEKGWNVSRKRRQVLGAEKCTWGPGYWCASKANAQECDAVEHCTKVNWSVSRKRRQLIGSNKCTWGPGYWCASDSNAQECDAVEHCTRNNWSVSRKRRQLVGANKCTWGPSYWCASKSNAEECGPGAVDHCNEKGWNVSRKRRQVLGAEKCTWGPGYWCASKANAQECDAVEHCTKVNWSVSRKRRQLVGSNKCTWGPGYWCASESNAQECDAVEHCTRNNWSVSRKRRQLVGSNKCTWGPGYWCASESNAQECDAVEHCTRNNWSVSRKRRQLVGSNKCTWGPGYWCASESNAQECDAVEHCTRNNWSVSRKRRQLVGSNKCTWGPGYWCASESNAQECDAVEHCTRNNWSVSRKRRQLVGSNKCTWGPGYWCANKSNAEECGPGAVEHCTRNNWSVSRKRRQLPGAQKCTWGPSYWCASKSNAEECGPGAVDHCNEKGWNVSRKRRQVLGAEKCTWGPGYWCASESNAKECDAVEHCNKHGYNLSRERREVLVGSNKCTWGPAYWCASASNARECGPEAVDHCQIIRKRRETLLGSKRCTWGPSYWCSNLANAQECNALEHCHNKVWKGSAPSS